MRKRSLRQEKGLSRSNNAGIQTQLSLIKCCSHCATWPHGYPPPSQAMLGSSEDCSVSPVSQNPSPYCAWAYSSASSNLVFSGWWCQGQEANTMPFSKYQDGSLALLPSSLWWFSMLCIIFPIVSIFLEGMFSSFLIQHYIIQIDAIDIMLG